MREGFLRKTASAVCIILVSMMLCGYVQYRRAENAELLVIASELSDTGDWEKGIETYKNYIEKNPEAFAVRKDLGTLYAWSEKWKKAQKELESYIERVPTDVEALEVLGDSYLYDNQYERALAVYKKILAIDETLKGRIARRIKEAEIARASYGTYSFSYYEESNRHLDYKAVTLEHDWEYYYLTQDNVYLVATLGNRFDDTLKKYTPIYGFGFYGQIFEKNWLNLTAKFEKDREVNTLCRLRLVYSMVPREKYVFTVSEETMWFWDRNCAQSVSMNLSRSFLKDNSLIVMASVFYDHIKKPSPYFVRIDTPPDGVTDKQLGLWTTALTLEKTFTVTDRIGYNIGGGARTNTDACSELNCFGGGTFKICDNMNLVLYGFWGYDTEKYIYCYGSAYTSVLF